MTTAQDITDIANDPFCYIQLARALRTPIDGTYAQQLAEYIDFVTCDHREDCEDPDTIMIY